MKKYLLSALALPLLFACSTDDFEKPVASNDPYPGIEKVNATFYMDEGPVTRMETKWALENGDLYGFAWMGTTTAAPTAETPGVKIDGNAYQNHNLIQTNGRFEPQTSIYVGKYYIYRPYDETTVSPQAIKFNSLKEQPMAEGFESSTAAWKGLAKSAIIIGDKWTEISPEGRTYLKPDGSADATVWDQPGIGKPYKVFAAVFSNQTLLELKYNNNNPTFAADKVIFGATDINHTYAAGTEAGAADIYGATVQLAGAANAFTYAPTVEPNAGVYPQTVNGEKVYHNGEFWATKAKGDVVGFTFAGEVQPIVLKAPVDKDKKVIPIGTGEEGHLGQFWFNSLPVTTGDAATAATNVTTTIQTSYGTVTIDDKTLKDVAYAFEQPHEGAEGYENEAKEWIKLNAAEADDLSKGQDKKTWKLAGADDHNTFVNQFGNHKGKYHFDNVDFSTAVMDIHIVDDAHLQKYLKFYMASGKNNGAELILDGDNEKQFKLSKISIALLQTINRSAAPDKKVLVKACSNTPAHNTPANGEVMIVVTQDGQTGDLAGKTEVPALNNVFAAPTRVYLAAKNSNGEDIAWTWGGDYDYDGDVEDDQALPVDNNVQSITNLGTITVNATNLELSHNKAIYNEAGATMNITKVTTAKTTLTNLGTINVGSATNTDAELRAYGKAITNDATSLTAYGIINNYGAVGVSEGTGDAAKFNNYGHIIMFGDAITLLTTNELDGTGDAKGPFSIPFAAGTNKMGTVELPAGKPAAIVSVSNAAETGFIKYNWDATTYSKATDNVKYNTIVIDNHNIEFTGDAPATEVQFIEFKNTNRALVVNPAGAASKLTALRGIIVNARSSIIIEKTNEVVCQDGAFLGEGATVYKGGAFTYPAGGTTNYLGNWTADQVVVFGN